MLHRPPPPATLLSFRSPFAAAALLDFLRARAIPGVEWVGRDVYRRSIEATGGPGWVESTARLEHLQVQTSAGDAGERGAIERRIAQLFDLDAVPHDVAARLQADASLRSRVARVPGLRVPGAWDPFELGVRAILGQQITVKGASTLAGRLVALCGRRVDSPLEGLTHLFPTADDLARADLSRVGLPVRRQETLRQFARAAAAGVLSLPPAEAVTALRKLPGIGAWTTEYMLMRAWRDADAFPASDLWLRRAAGEESVASLLVRAERWRPWRAYAAMYLWQVPAS